MVAAMSEVTTMEAISHTYPVMPWTWTEAASVIPAASAIHSPAMPTTVNMEEMRPSEIEVITVRIAGIDTKVPITGVPIKRTVEICRIHIHAILPIKQYITEVEVALLPISPIQIGLAIDTHEVVKVHLVSSFILFFREVQLIRHLVCEE